jgi:hypothetical protein
MRHVLDSYVTYIGTLSSLLHHWNAWSITCNPRLEGNGWLSSACELCMGTFRVPMQRHVRLATSASSMSLIHLHQAASVFEGDGVGYSFSLHADSGEIQDGRARDSSTC